MKRWRRMLRCGWLLVSAHTAVVAALIVASGEQDAGWKEQNDAMPEPSDEKSQLRRVAAVDDTAVRPRAQGELADEEVQLRSVADVDGDAVRPTAPTQRGVLAAYPAAIAAYAAAIAALTVASDEQAADSHKVAEQEQEDKDQQLHNMLAFTNGYERKLESELKLKDLSPSIPLLQHKAASEHELVTLEEKIVKTNFRRDMTEIALKKAETELSDSRQRLRNAEVFTTELEGMAFFVAFFMISTLLCYCFVNTTCSTREKHDTGLPYKLNHQSLLREVTFDAPREREDGLGTKDSLISFAGPLGSSFDGSRQEPDARNGL